MLLLLTSVLVFVLLLTTPHYVHSDYILASTSQVVIITEDGVISTYKAPFIFSTNQQYIVGQYYQPTNTYYVLDPSHPMLYKFDVETGSTSTVQLKVPQDTPLRMLCISPSSGTMYSVITAYPYFYFVSIDKIDGTMQRVTDTFGFFGHSTQCVVDDNKKQIIFPYLYSLSTELLTVIVTTSLISGNSTWYDGGEPNDSYDKWLYLNRTSGQLWASQVGYVYSLELSGSAIFRQIAHTQNGEGGAFNEDKRVVSVVYLGGLISEVSVVDGNITKISVDFKKVSGQILPTTFNWLPSK